MTTEPSQGPEPVRPSRITRAYKKWLRDTPEGQQEQRAIKERIFALQEKWDRQAT